MEATAARIIPIVAAQERTAAMQLPASPIGASNLQPESIAAPANGTASVTPAADSAADAVTNASAVSCPLLFRWYCHALPCTQARGLELRLSHALTNLFAFAAHSRIRILHGAIGTKSFRAYEAH
jgi:hypothetical protein